MAVEAERGPGRPPGAAGCRRSPALREVADVAVVVSGGAAEHAQLARGERDEAEDGFDERGLADAVRAEDGDELVRVRWRGRRRTRSCVRPTRTVPPRIDYSTVSGLLMMPSACLAAARYGNAVDRRGRAHPLATCGERASANCLELLRLPVLEGHVLPGGVSVMVVTAMPLARASSTSACTSGVEFWLLNTNTLICLPVICWSMVALSCAVGSVPSLMAVRNDDGVSRLRPVAWAMPTKMLSLAPTGVRRSSVDLGEGVLVVFERRSSRTFGAAGRSRRRRRGRSSCSRR